MEATHCDGDSWGGERWGETCFCLPCCVCDGRVELEDDVQLLTVRLYECQGTGLASFLVLPSGLLLGKECP